MEGRSSSPVRLCRCGADTLVRVFLCLCSPCGAGAKLVCGVGSPTRPPYADSLGGTPNLRRVVESTAAAFSRIYCNSNNAEGMLLIARLTRRRDRSQPSEQFTHSWTKRWPPMIPAAHRSILVGSVQVPQRSMQEFGSIVRIDKVVVANLQVNRQTRFADAACVGPCPVRGIVGSEEFWITATAAN